MDRLSVSIANLCLSLSLVLFLLHIPISNAHPPLQDLTTVRELTFVKDRFTVNRVARPNDWQLRVIACINGLRDFGTPCDSVRYPGLVYCTSSVDMDIGDEHLRWHCIADLPKGIAISQTDISCEYYPDRHSDMNIIGSCSLAYVLEDSRGSEYDHSMSESFTQVKHD